ncbi:MAG: hypothetical protein ACE5HS_22790, partial [bacterium]
MTNDSLKRISFMAVFTVAPFLLLMIENQSVQTMTFLILGGLFVVSRYLPAIKNLSETLEIILLF